MPKDKENLLRKTGRCVGELGGAYVGAAASLIVGGVELIRRTEFKEVEKKANQIFERCIEEGGDLGAELVMIAVAVLVGEALDHYES